MRRTRVGVTLGEGAGIGPEVLGAALRQEQTALNADLCLVLPRPWLTWWAQGIGSGLEAIALHPVDLPFDLPEPTPGQPTEAGRLAARRCLEALVALGRERQVDALVTGPVTKAIFAQGGPSFPGQTEAVAAGLGASEFAMMLAGPRLRVVLATTHLPLREVPAALTEERIVRTARVAWQGLERWYGIARPRIAVAALNPHAGEGGRMGDEEGRVIAPAIERLRAQGLAVDGPAVPDVVFHKAWSGAYDAVVAMYHDQGLGPLKLVHFDEAVNVTLGLPVPRLSPDHGTAFDIAGQGRAKPDSMVCALRQAVLFGTRALPDGPC